jgi:preprotein translocase subunit YajC
MGMWIELGIFLLVFVFAYFQLKELKQEKLKREKERLAAIRKQEEVMFVRL